MTGLKRRVSIGFLSIAILLFISGVIAFFELNTLSHSTESLLNINKRKMELGREMLHLTQVQDEAILNITLLGDHSFDTVCANNIIQLKRAINGAYKEGSARATLDTLKNDLKAIESLTSEIITQCVPDSMMYQRGVASYGKYQLLNQKITRSIYSYTTASLSSMAPRAQQLQSNAYRAVTPVLIALIVMIAIVMMLYYFMIIYCVNPIVRLNKSLGDFVNFKLPFTVKDDCNDEVKELQEKIETVTNQLKKRV